MLVFDKVLHEYVLTELTHLNKAGKYQQSANLKQFNVVSDVDVCFPKTFSLSIKKIIMLNLEEYQKI